MRIEASGRGKLVKAPDMEEFRAWNRRKSRRLADKQVSEHEAVSRYVSEGSYLGLDLYGIVRCPMSLAREIVRQRIGGLALVTPGVLDGDLLLAAGLVRTLDMVYVGLEVHGTSAALRRAVESGQVQCVEWSNGAMAWRLKAAAMGVPFLPTKSMLGSDTFVHSAAKVAIDPFTGTTVCLVPAAVLDVAFIHVHRADCCGNAQIEGTTGFALEMARAARRLVISAEEIVATAEIRKYPDRTVIPYYLVDAVVHAPFGSHPGEMPYVYARDEPAIQEWVAATKTQEGAEDYLSRYVHGTTDHRAYLDLFGEERLQGLRHSRGTRD